MVSHASYDSSRCCAVMASRQQRRVQMRLMRVAAAVLLEAALHSKVLTAMPLTGTTPHC